MKKRIMILANNSGGLFDFRKDLIQEMLKKGHTIIAYTPFDTRVDELKEMSIDLREIKLDRRGMNPIKEFSLFRLFYKEIKREKPDLVLTYTIKPNLYGGISCGLLNIPYAMNITGLGKAFINEGIIKKMIIFLYKRACKKANVIFFENSGNRDVFVDNNIISIGKTQVLNGAGVNTDYFVLQEYPKGDVTKFLFVGRIMQEKGINELFEAMKRLIADGEKVELHVLGGFEESYKEIVDKYTAEGWLYYYGYQLDVRPYIAKSSCFVLPSWHEGMANTNLENAASGRPVITSNIHGCMEAVEDSVTGYLTEVGNAEDLYRNMKKFLRLSYEERRQMGLKGRERMIQLFEKKKVVLATLEFLKL